jgi:hypothetical protein
MRAHWKCLMAQRKLMSMAALLAVAAFTTAHGQPVNVAPGDTNIPVPLFSGTLPSITVLDSTGLQTETSNGVTVMFQELAVDSSANPSGVSFGFAIATSNAPTALGAMLPGFAGFNTAVQSCDPFSMGSVGVCGSASGWVSRSTGTGDVLSFTGIGTTPVQLPTVGLSNIYGIATNAPGFMDSTVTVSDDGTTFTFNGLSPSVTSVPEPGTLTLMLLALVGLVATRRLRVPVRLG